MNDNNNHSLQKHDIVVLDINEDTNFFYSNEYIKIDSINNLTNKRKLFAYPNFKKIILYKRKNEEFEFINNLSMNFYVYTTKKEIKWFLLDEHKKIGDYLVQKAECMYGGRKWIAWFTAEIPLPYGPYVFYGLPGLILEVYDKDENYVFTFYKNTNFPETIDTENILNKYLGVRKFNIEEKDWRQVQLNFYENPIPEYKDGNAIMLKDNGTQYSPHDYRELEKNIRKNIKNNNNPIELDEKIDYK